MKNNLRIAIITSFFFLTFFSFGQQVLLSWETPNPNLPVYPSTFNATGLESSTVIRGESLRLPDETNLNAIFAASGFTSSREEAFRDGDYFEFEIEPTNGNQVNLSGLRAKFRRNNIGPREFLWQFKVDSDCSFTDIESSFRYTEIGDVNLTENPNGNFIPEIDLSTIPRLQNVSFPSKIIIRLYAWDILPTATANSVETFGFGRNPRSEDNIIITGEVSPSTGPTETLLATVWDGTSWSNGVPSPLNQPIRQVVINADYSTVNGNIKACSLTVNPSATLTVEDETFVEVINDVVVNGNLEVSSMGNFVQNSDISTFTLANSGTSMLNKITSVKSDWYYYTYWSSPVLNGTLGDIFAGTSNNRRFLFNASNFLDEDGDGIDDDANDWQVALPENNMLPGIGYAVTSANAGSFPRRDLITFNGQFNNGPVTTPIVHDSRNTNGSWNLIGNPYPSAIDFDLFYQENSDVVDGAVYFWSHSSPFDSNNPGNAALNFNRNDYSVYNTGVGGITAPGASGIRPDKYIPTGQSFFISGLRNGDVTFTNLMRVASETSNINFFKTTTSFKRNTAKENKLWLTLTLENTILNEILVGYVNNATDKDDGSNFDTPRLSVSSNTPSIVYFPITDSNKKYAIQGKSLESIGKNEVINLGFDTGLDIDKLFKISISNLEGEFLKNNAIYLKDNLLNKTHNLKESDYLFKTTTGEFPNRFQIVFTESNVLSVKDNFTIINSGNNMLQFNTNSNKTIERVDIYDILGKKISTYRGKSNREIFKLERFKNNLYIAKIKLSDGSVILKKGILNLKF